MSKVSELERENERLKRELEYERDYRRLVVARRFWDHEISKKIHNLEPLYGLRFEVS